MKEENLRYRAALVLPGIVSGLADSGIGAKAGLKGQVGYAVFSHDRVLHSDTVWYYVLEAVLLAVFMPALYETLSRVPVVKRLFLGNDCAYKTASAVTMGRQ